MSQNLHKVFVYGTLKKGEPNHHWFTKDEAAAGYHRYLFDAKTVEKFPLIIATNYNIPFLLYSPGQGQNVRGEVYEVDDQVLAQLDILEEYPDYYTREIQEVEQLDGEKIKCKVWIYMIKDFKPEFLKRQMYDCYSSFGSHGLQYVDSELINMSDLDGPHL